MDTTKPPAKQTHINQDEASKRSKVQKLSSISIEDLNAKKAGNTFQGDVLVVYKVTLDKINKTREVLRADLTDTKAEMTTTLNVIGSLEQRYENKIIPGIAISISDFDVAARTDYDRGDTDYILILKETSKVETMPRLCQEYKFIPSSTIKQLLTCTNDYPIGTIGALVTSTKKIGSQYAIDIKDGHGDMDRALLYLHPNFIQQYVAMEIQLQQDQTPAMLFKNIVKRADQSQINSFRTGPATFICKLNDKRTLESLNMLLNSTSEVSGTLTVRNPYSNPFHAFCPHCNYKFGNYGMLEDNTAHCNRCDKQVTYICSLHLKTLITTTSKQPFECFAEKSFIEQYLPAFKNMTYEDYIKDKSAVIFILRDFTMKGNFTLDRNNIITNAIYLDE